MTRLYEGMFLLDNQVVREDWKKAKGIVLDALKKHGGRVVCARRWDERKLAFTIRRRRRATYCLAYYEIPDAGLAHLRRDLELNENVLRYLMLRSEAVPEGEAALAAAEDAADFAVPAPPPDDAPDAPEPEPQAAPEEGEPEAADPEVETEEATASVKED